jgi:signal transduction histidine kinase
LFPRPSFIVPKKSESKLPPPILSEVRDRDLGIESTLRDLPLYYFQVEQTTLCYQVTDIFEKNPLLPGAILLDNGRFLGMISRQRLLEYLIRPRAIDLFLNAPVQLLYSYARTDLLILADTTKILAAARMALRRSPQLLSEPIVVKMESGDYQLLNINELNVAYWQIRGIETQLRFENMQTQLIQTEKMASLGRLVDGVAHEILDPVGFIWGNLTYVTDYTQSLIELMAAYEQAMPELNEEIEELQEDIEFEYLKQDLPRSLESIKKGAERLKNLATSLQNFCHLDEVYPKPADLHVAIDGVLLLLKSRLSGEIKVVKKYGHLPPVPCYIGQLNQVFMNILGYMIDGLINQAFNENFDREFGEVDPLIPVESTSKFIIEIRTEMMARESGVPDIPDARWVSITIKDNGAGMSPEKLQKLYASFSSNHRRVEKETSLAVSYGIVTAKHGGEFKVRSQPGQGTAFEISLPVY